MGVESQNAKSYHSTDPYYYIPAPVFWLEMTAMQELAPVFVYVDGTYPFAAMWLKSRV